MGDPTDRDLESLSCEERRSPDIIKDYRSNPPPTQQLDHTSETAEHNRRTSTRRPPPSELPPQLSDLRAEWTSRNRAHQLFSQISGYSIIRSVLSFTGRYLALLLVREVNVKPMPKDLESVGLGSSSSQPMDFILLLDFETGKRHTCVLSGDPKVNSSSPYYSENQSYGLGISNRSIIVLVEESSDVPSEEHNWGLYPIELPLKDPPSMLFKEAPRRSISQGYIHGYTFSHDGEKLAICVSSRSSWRSYRVQLYHITEQRRFFDRSLWDFIPEDNYSSDVPIDISLAYKSSTFLAIYSYPARAFSVLNPETGELISKQVVDEASGFLFFSKRFSKVAELKNGVVTVRDGEAKTSFSYRFPFVYSRIVFLPENKLMLVFCYRSGSLRLLNAEKREKIKEWALPSRAVADMYQNYRLVVSGDGRVAVITHPNGVWGWGPSTSH